MGISASEVKELREKTGAGLMTCKKALEETNGNMEQAIDELRKKGAAKAASKSDRSTAEGVIAVSGRAIVKILCETDFVARNDQFIAFADELVKKAEVEGADAVKAFFKEIKGDKIQTIGENIVLEDVQIVEGGSVIGSYVHSNNKVATIVALDGGNEELARDAAMHATAMAPLVANPEDVPAKLIEKEKEIAREQLIAAGKPENILDKIIEGKIKKFCAERALTSQPFVKNPDVTVAEHLGDTKLVTFVRAAI